MFKKIAPFLVVTLVFLVVIFGCMKSDKQKEFEKAAKQLEKAGKKMAETGEEMARGGAEQLADGFEKMGEALGTETKIEPVDFRELKELLPDRLPGMKRVDATGERTKAFGINVSQAEGVYETKDGDSSIEIKITDMGNVRGVVAMAAMAWSVADIDRESDTGYEKTLTYRGHKAFEKYDREDESGSIDVFVAKRFHVEVEGDGVKMREIKNALDKTNVKRLERLKNHGVKE